MHGTPTTVILLSVLLYVSISNSPLIDRQSARLSFRFRGAHTVLHVLHLVYIALPSDVNVIALALLASRLWLIVRGTPSVGP